MNTVAQPAASVNWNEYQRRSADSRRGSVRPSKAQQAAFAKLMARGGRATLTVEEMGLLATMSTLTASQRAEFATMAQAAIETAVQA